MRIQGYRPEDVAGAGQAQGAQGTDRAQQGSSGAAAAAGRGTDRVEVSNDARLVSSALRAASSSPNIRQDVVERAKVKLAAGEVGNDVHRLADKMIDSLMSR
jgi:negative regulator of flagellin synthesis FlgM